VSESASYPSSSNISGFPCVFRNFKYAGIIRDSSRVPPIIDPANTFVDVLSRIDMVGIAL